MKAGAHIATLNYDDLLYETFVGTDVFSGHRLRDGFFNGIFDIEKHQTYMDLNPNQEGWFLHLHGSPLFVTQNGVSRKLTRFDLRDQQGIESTHLVLTNVKYKMSAIGSSEILRAYWLKFKSIAKAAKNIVILGYGGGDNHLNDILSLAKSDSRIRIIERSANKVREERVAFWSDKIRHGNIDCVLVDSILDFHHWCE